MTDPARTTKDRVIAYHFVGKTLRDGRAIPADGEWLEHQGVCEICETGLHASEHPFDAMQYAPGPILCMVECEDVQDRHDDKFVCRRRKIIARVDATKMLRAMSRWCALQVIHLWDAPPVVREYLETGDESKRDAARDAANAAAWAAGRDAANAAAWAAARAAAWDTARDAAWEGANAAANAAAWAAARDAAWDAAWDTARAAARDTQRAEFKRRVDAEFAKVTETNT